MKKLLGLLLLVSAGASHAGLIIDLTGTPGSSTVSMTISGSGVWTADRTEDVILYNDIAAAFAGPALAIGSGDLNPADNDWISLDAPFTLINNGVNVTFDRIYIQDEGNVGSGDDLSLGTSLGSFSTFTGQAWSIPLTTVTFDISALGDPDSGATFDDLGLGGHIANIYSGSHQTGELVLTVSVADGAVPSPTSALLLGLGLAGLAQRRRKHR